MFILRGSRSGGAASSVGRAVDRVTRTSGREIFEPDGGVVGRPSEAILGPPVRGVDEVTEPDRARLATGFVHDDHGVALGADRA